VTDGDARRKLCVRICGSAAADSACANGAHPSETAAGEAQNGAKHDDGAAATADALNRVYERVVERTAGMHVDPPAGVEVITDMWAFKRRQTLLPSPV
jgi:predicted lipid-binding transport protein (Tim44 family)